MYFKRLILIVTLAACPPSLFAAPIQEPAASVAQLIDGLSGETFRQRQSAMHDLTERGLDIIPELIGALEYADPETRWRIAKTVEDIGLSGDERTMRKVTRIMFLLGTRGMTGLMEKSARMRDLWLESQVQQVCQQLADLGATVSVSTQFEMAMDGLPLEMMGTIPADDSAPTAESNLPVPAEEDLVASPQTAPAATSVLTDVAQILAASDSEDVQAIANINVRSKTPDNDLPPNVQGFGPIWADSAIPQQYYSRVVTIGSQWTGTSDDLQLLTKVSRLSRANLSAVELTSADWDSLAKVGSLQSVLVHQCAYQSADAFEFRRRRPDVYVQVVGRGFLGVTGPAGRSEEPCVLTEVRSNTGAEQAGLEMGDLIVSIDGVAVKSFSDLILVVGSRNAGDEIEIEYQRDGQTVKTAAVLQPRSPEFQ
jgi:hypothetical protein